MLRVVTSSKRYMIRVREIDEVSMHTLTQKRSFLLIATVVILPISILAVVSVMGDAGNLANPCFSWGISGGSTTASSAGPCISSGASSQTIAQMLWGLTTIQGGILFGSILGLLGILRTNKTLLAASSAILLLESIPLVLGGSFILTLIPAVLFMTIRMRSEKVLRPSQVNSSR